MFNTKFTISKSELKNWKANTHSTLEGNELRPVHFHHYVIMKSFFFYSLFKVDIINNIVILLTYNMLILID